MSFKTRKCFKCDYCDSEVMEGEQINWLNLKTEGVGELGAWGKEGVRPIAKIENCDFCSHECLVGYFSKHLGSLS